MALTKKPCVIVQCVANTHTRPDERIIELSFPGRADAASGMPPDCLIRMHNRPNLPRPLVEVYRTDNEIDVVAPAKTFWAAWCRPDGVGEASLSLHRTKTEALHWIAELMEVRLTDEGAGGEGVQPLTDDELIENLEEAMNEHNAGEWDLEEVQEP